MQILLSNDDGVQSIGLRKLYKELQRLGDVTVVAPLSEMSTCGHSLTLHKPLRLVKIDKDIYGVSGTPADCINVGMSEVLKKKPDLVVSGVNRGANLGQDIFYSGTVSAAREALLAGIPSYAVSLNVNFHRPPSDEEANYETASKVTVKVIKKLLKEGVVPQDTLINLNVPDVKLSALKGIKVGRQGLQIYGKDLVKRIDHRGKDYFWVGGKYKGFKKESGTDCDVVSKGYASITPVRIDCTDYSTLEDLGKWYAP